MFGDCRLRPAACASLAALALAAGSASAQSDPRATALLKAISSRLAAARALSFVAEETAEPRRRIEVTVQQPDKLRLDSSGPRRNGWIECNGRTMTSYSSDEKALVIEQVPPTLEICARVSFQAVDFDFPIAELIAVSRAGDPIASLKRVRYVRTQVVDGTPTDVVMFSRDGGSVELWVGTGDRLPKMIRTIDARRVQRTVTLSNWQIDATPQPIVVTSPQPARGEQVQSREVQAVGTTGIEPIPQAPPVTVYPYVEDFWRERAEAPPDTVRYAAPYDVPSGAPYVAPNVTPYNHSPDGYSYPSSGQVQTSLPAGCAAPYPYTPAFYLCGNTWFVGVVGPQGIVYYKVISPP